MKFDLYQKVKVVKGPRKGLCGIVEGYYNKKYYIRFAGTRYGFLEAFNEFYVSQLIAK